MRSWLHAYETIVCTQAYLRVDDSDIIHAADDENDCQLKPFIKASKRLVMLSNFTFSQRPSRLITYLSCMA